MSPFLAIVDGVKPKQLCQPCRLVRPAFERAVAYGGYGGTLRALIHALKYDGMLPVAEKLGGLLAEAILTLDEGREVANPASPFCDLLVIAVPLHASRYRQRGFNHAELLARAAIKSLRGRRPEWRLTLATGLLERTRVTQSQSGLSPRQRRANLRGVFLAPKPEQLKGKHVLLVDDIYTTGATARACSQVMRRAGAASVRVATVARPQMENAAIAQFANEEPALYEDVAFWGSKQAPSVPQALIAADQTGKSWARNFWGRKVCGQSHDSRS